MNSLNTPAAIVVLLAANGFYVAAEFALVNARDFRIASLAAEGGSAARLTDRIQGKQPSQRRCLGDRSSLMTICDSASLMRWHMADCMCYGDQG
jgi:hypothetical protein